MSLPVRASERNAQSRSAERLPRAKEALGCERSSWLAAPVALSARRSEEACCPVRQTSSNASACACSNASDADEHLRLRTKEAKAARRGHSDCSDRTSDCRTNVVAKMKQARDIVLSRSARSSRGLGEQSSRDHLQELRNCMLTWKACVAAVSSSTLAARARSSDNRSCHKLQWRIAQLRRRSPHFIKDLWSC
jgi:hypothetical protein